MESQFLGHPIRSLGPILTELLGRDIWTQSGPLKLLSTNFVRNDYRQHVQKGEAGSKINLKHGSQCGDYSVVSTVETYYCYNEERRRVYRV
jgi:hypothetical protein